MALVVAPQVIDKKALPRDIIQEHVVLKNDAGGKIWLYTDVENIAQSQPRDGYADPDAGSLTDWLEITRGVIQLEAGEEKQIPLTLKISLRAKPGMYHAQVLFMEGSDRASAGLNRTTAVKVLVNVEILEDVKERLQLKKFGADRIFFPSFPASFSYSIENIGNRALGASGEIRIYDRGGKEIAAVPVDGKGSISPDTTLQFASAWEGANFSFGRYKAMLNLSYGQQARLLQDTAYFWVVPWRLLLILFGILALCVAGGVYIWHRRQFESARRRQSHATDSSYASENLDTGILPVISQEIPYAESEVRLPGMQRPPRAEANKPAEPATSPTSRKRKRLYASKHVVDLKS